MASNAAPTSGHDEDLTPVKTPSGSMFWVYGRERKYWDDRVKRYLADNHFCVPAGTIITTPFGPVPIEDKPDEGWVYDEETQEILVAPLIIRSAAAQEVVTIRTGARTLRCSPNHPVLLMRPRRSMRVGSIGQPSLHASYEWTPAAEIARGDLLVAQHDLPDFGSDLSPTRSVSEGFAEFCGIFTGDGLVVAGRYVRICRAANTTYMAHYRQVMEDEFRKCSGAPVVVSERGGYSEFGSADAVRELVELGLTGGSHEKRIPAWVFGLSAKLRAAYLRGYVDADGSVDKNGRISFGSPNLALIMDFRSLAIGLGLHVSNLSSSERDACLPQGGTSHVVCHRFSCTNAALNAHVVGSYDERYIARWEGKLPFAPDGGSTIGKKTRIVPPPNTILSRVRSVSVASAEPMFDVVSPDHHTFIADGVITHNTNVADLQVLDRIIMLELFCWRYGVWQSQQEDYWHEPVDESQLGKQIKEASTELRQLVQTLGIDKVSRDKVRGEDSVSKYIENLKIRAREFGVMREEQLSKSLELMAEIKARVTLYDQCTPDERREMQCDIEHLLDWMRTVAFPQYDAVDEHFRQNKQRFWIRDM